IHTLQAATFAEADVDVTSMPGSNPGLIARYVDRNNFYLGELQNTNGSYFATIARMSGGVLTNLASLPVSSAYGTLRFAVAGVSLKLFLNGNLVSFASDASVTAAGAVGIDGTQGTTFQNFSAAVVQVSSTTLPPTFIHNFS